MLAMAGTRSAGELWFGVELLAARETDPDLLQLARERVAWLLRLAPAPAEPSDERLQAVSAFADQFVIDVAGITPEQRTALLTALGTDALGFVQALYVVDLGTRRAVLRPRLVDGVDDAPVEPEPEATLWSAIEAFMRTVARLDALDPLTSELVRLRGAAMHNCRLCRSRRSAEATDLAPELDLLAVAERFEHADIDERARVALRLTDVMLSQPTELPARAVTAARARFTAVELDELLFDVVRNAANKIAVAFGADAPQVTDGVELFTLDAAGEVVTG